MRTNPNHEVAFQDLCGLVSRHADRLSALELLAVASNMIGKLLIALQDQRTITSEAAMNIVMRNIEIGNQQAFAELLETKGSA